MTIEVTQQNRLLIVGKRYERHLWRLCGKTACLGHLCIPAGDGMMAPS